MQEEEQERRDDRILLLEKELEDLRKRLPAHSLKPSMWRRLEELEEELAVLKAGSVDSEKRLN